MGKLNVINPLQSLSEAQQKEITLRYKAICKSLDDSDCEKRASAKTEKKQLEWLFGKNFFSTMLYGEKLRLLFTDLSARLLYDVKVSVNGRGPFLLTGITLPIDGSSDIENAYVTTDTNEGYGTNNPLECVQPYLFPLSSMDEGQKKEFNDKYDAAFRLRNGINLPLVHDFHAWLNMNHLDHHYLIPRGMAIDATGLNIY